VSNTNCYYNSKKVLSAVEQEYAGQHGQEVPEEFSLVLQALVLTRYPADEIDFLAEATTGEESKLAAFVAWFLNNDARYSPPWWPETDTTETEPSENEGE
jgi:hypothetical protein